MRSWLALRAFDWLFHKDTQVSLVLPKVSEQNKSQHETLDLQRRIPLVSEVLNIFSHQGKETLDIQMVWDEKCVFP